MKSYFSQKTDFDAPVEEDYNTMTLRESIQKINEDLEIAYSGFDNAVDADMIDCYIYRINSLQKQYKHLSDLAALEAVSQKEPVREKNPVRALINQVFG